MPHGGLQRLWPAPVPTVSVGAATTGYPSPVSVGAATTGYSSPAGAPPSPAAAA